MKKIKITLFAFLSLSLTIVSCDKDFEETNTDPNNSSVISSDLLLSYAQLNQMNTVYGMQRGGGDMGSCWAQQMSKVQYNDENRYVVRSGVIDDIWFELYTTSVAEANGMYDLALEAGNTNQQGIALVMKAVGFQTLTDLFGPIPFTESLNPDITKPAYDDEATVYEGILTLLTDAANLLSNGTGEVATSDLYYQGNTSKWLKLANSLKFRALMRISSTRDVSSELQALINGGKMMTTNSDGAQIQYLSAPDDANPIYKTIIDGLRPEYKLGGLMVETLQFLNDDRLSVYASVNASGVYLGKPAGYGRQTTLPNEGLGYTYANISGLGDFYLNPELPGVLMSYSQLSFLKAEAANENLITGGITAALNYYREGIAASFKWNGVDSTSYLAQDGLNFTTQADAREKIATQEWIALFGQGFEAWTEWRRTKIPYLEPALESTLGQIPSRLSYSTDDPSLNGENYEAASQSIGGDLLTSSLFWQ